MFQEKQSNQDCYMLEDEDFEIALQTMINQLDQNELEIMKSKSASLFVLKSLSNLLLLMQNNYEDKMSQWESELHKLRTLNENIVNQIGRCLNSEVNKTVTLSDSIVNILNDSDNIASKEYIEKTFNNEAKATTVPAKQSIKIYDRQDNMFVESMEPPEISDLENGFDLEKELKKFPILMSILEDKDEPGSSLPTERSPTNSTTFRIYEFSNQNIKPCNDNEVKSSGTQIPSEGLQNLNENMPSNRSCKLFDECKLLEVLKRLFRMDANDDFKILNSTGFMEPKTVGKVANRQQTCCKVQNSDNINTSNNKMQSQCVSKNFSNIGVNNVSWYSGPSINQSCSSDCSSNNNNNNNTNNNIKMKQLFEYKVRQRRGSLQSTSVNPAEYRSWREVSSQWKKSVNDL